MDEVDRPPGRGGKTKRGVEEGSSREGARTENEAAASAGPRRERRRSDCEDEAKVNGLNGGLSFTGWSFNVLH